jgi:hypothetical protein
MSAQNKVAQSGALHPLVLAVRDAMAVLENMAIGGIGYALWTRRVPCAGSLWVWGWTRSSEVLRAGRLSVLWRQGVQREKNDF